MSEWDVRDGETPIDVSDLVDRSIASNRAELYDAEAANILKAFIKYDTAKPTGGRDAFSFKWILAVHRDMFCDVWRWAGQIRNVDLNIGVRWETVAQELCQLAFNVEVWQPENDDAVLTQSVQLHHQAVKVHPFKNGNGRWARFIANIWLRRRGMPRIEWPDRDVSVGSGAVRATYLDAIRQADKFDYGPLIELHRRFWPAP